MSGKAAGAAALACGNAACGKALAPPLLQCSKCKGEAYCCKACQIAAWKAGHKHKCGAPGQGGSATKLGRPARAGAARAEATRAPAGVTAEQGRLGMRLCGLVDACDWLGVVALAREALALAQEIRAMHPDWSGLVYGWLGSGFLNTGDYGRAREMHEQCRAICEALGDRAGVAVACCNLGRCYFRTGDYGRARELHEQHKAMAEALGDRAGVATACGNLGNCYHSTGDYGRAREMHEHRRAVAEAVGDREGVAAACGSLGNCCYSTGNFGRARELYEQHRAMAEALENRAGVAAACANLGNCYCSTGDYGRARAMHEQCRAICEALGDRAGVAAACTNLGLCHLSTGNYGQARELNQQARAICEALGDRTGLSMACGSLGRCCLNTGDYGQAISYFTQQYDMAKELKLGKDQAEAALCMGVALRLEVRTSVRGRAAGASQLPGPPASTLACSDDGVREAEKWLQTALDLGLSAARLHLAHLVFDTGPEDTALAHLQDYLSFWVERGRNRCAGCSQTRGEDAQMLTCGGCRVARFCSVEHQKMAAKSVASGGCVVEGRHKDVCGVLGKWRQHVVKDGMSPDVLRADLLAFLRQ